MANEIDGRDIYLIIDDDKFANESGLTNSENSDMLETTNKHTTNKRKTYLSSESTGTITCNGMYCVTDPTDTTGYHDLKAKQKAGTKIAYEVGYFADGGIIEAGNGFIQSITMNANRNEVATYDITIQKDGDYSEDTYSS